MERILVVDDEMEILKLVKIELETDGYQVGIARTGQEALRRARETMPDLILMDVMLPDISGVEAVKALKANSATSQIPIIFLTALFSKEEHNPLVVDQQRYLTVAKPFTSEELLSQIRKCLGHLSNHRVR